MVKINGTTANMFVDSGAQSTVLGERQFNDLVRSGIRSVNKETCVCMGMVVFQLWVNLRLRLNVMGRKQ